MSLYKEKDLEVLVSTYVATVGDIRRASAQNPNLSVGMPCTPEQMAVLSAIAGNPRTPGGLLTQACDLAVGQDYRPLMRALAKNPASPPSVLKSLMLKGYRVYKNPVFQMYALEDPTLSWLLPVRGLVTLRMSKALESRVYDKIRASLMQAMRDAPENVAFRVIAQVDEALSTPDNQWELKVWLTCLQKWAKDTTRTPDLRASAQRLLAVSAWWNKGAQ
jgi:hypothetical protein